VGQHSTRRRALPDLHRSAKSTKRKPRGIETGRYYHWNNEPNLARLAIDLDYVRKVVKREMTRSGAVNIYSFLDEKGLYSIYLRLTGKKDSTSVVLILKRICKELNVDPNDIEKKGIILNPRIFPIDMSSKEFIKLKSHVLNEGRIAFRWRSVGRLGYSNQDPVLLRYFTDLVRGLGGDIHREPRFARYVLLVEANPALARALDASGLSYGRKTRTDPPLDPLIKPNSSLFRYHIQATLTEEGWCSLIIAKGRRIQFVIAWGRSVDITDKLADEQIEYLRQIAQTRRKIPIGSIEDTDLLREISLNTPRSLGQELTILALSHKNKQWPEGLPTKVHISKKGRITVFWEIHFNTPELIDLIHDKYGMLPSTWKSRRFENLYDVYVKYRGKKLTDEEIREVSKFIEENQPKVSAEWISEKIRELFPSVEWGADIEWIRKKLGREKNK